MSSQNNQSQTQLLGLLTKIVEQNNLLIQQNQIQVAQINELLLMLEEQEEASEHGYLDE